uniref:Uncharacterized protein n=1 Tax=Fagus sylvatica TaxID=28930 RepID=A0A2N9J828_FAGSY
MWCLMLCEPMCGIQIHSKEALGFSDLLVGVNGNGRGWWVFGRGGGCLTAL